MMKVLILLQIPFAACLILLIMYVVTRRRKYKTWFHAIFFLGSFIVFNISFFSLFYPQRFKQINLLFLYWIISGYLMLMMILIKIHIFRKIYKRHQDPSNYHFNFFGKKVMDTSSITNREMRQFMITIPIFLFSGSYFVARLVNLILFGRL